MTSGQDDSKTAGEMDSRTAGQQDSRTDGHQDIRTKGEMDNRQDRRTAGQHDRKTAGGKESRTAGKFGWVRTNNPQAVVLRMTKRNKEHSLKNYVAAPKGGKRIDLERGIVTMKHDMVQCKTLK